MVQPCESCDEPAERRCAGCSKVWYCRRSCQESHWFIHLFDCKPKDQITTADYLFRSTVGDEIPCDEQTRHDYGFTRAFSGPNQSKLLGTYIGLMSSAILGVKARTLHKWRINGTLVQNIISKFETLPPDNRGDYYPWFLENHWWVLDGQLVPRVEEMEGAMKEIETAMSNGWIYSGGSSATTTKQIKEICANWPKEKATCMLFCGMMLSGTNIPGPDMAAWKQFGFCTCDHPHKEMGLGRLYTKLVLSCTFQEFLSAFESSRLADLFIRKGLEFELSLYPHLKELLRNSPHMFYSVWELKKLVVESDQEAQIIPSVFVDYGFVNCRTQEERNDLKAVYKEYFLDRKSDPPALHHACIQGKILDYISTIVKLKEKKKYRRLMTNPYPLREVL